MQQDSYKKIVGYFKKNLKIFWNNLKEALLDKGEDMQLGRKHRPKYSIVVLSTILAVLGFLLVFSAAPSLFDNMYSSATESCKIFSLIPSDNIIDCKMTEFLVIQVFYLVAGLVCFFIATKIPAKFWRRGALIFLILAFGLSILLIISHALNLPLAIEAGGAVRWLKFGPFTFQPAELMKLAILLFSASFLASAHTKGQLNSVKKTILPLLTVLIVGLFFVAIFQSDFSSALVIFAIVLAQLIVSGMKFRGILIFIAPFMVAGFFALMFFSYRLGRISDFLSEQCLPGDDLSQICSSLMSLGSGGVFGRGLGQGLSVFWVPQVMDDAIFSLVGETFGFVGSVAVLIIFIALLYRILNLSEYLPNMYFRLICAGTFGWIGLQTIINIGAFTKTIPLTGITLPFISSGGSSLICVMVTMGVIFTISRYTSYSKVKKENGSDENTLRRRGIGRTRYASSGNNIGD
jgi:Bacterial cell division membrane protein